MSMLAFKELSSGGGVGLVSSNNSKDHGSFLGPMETELARDEEEVFVVAGSLASHNGAAAATGEML